MAKIRRTIISKLQGAIAAVAGALGAGLLVVASPSLATEVVLPVPRVTIYPGDVISEAMIFERAFRGSDSAASGYVSSYEGLIGKVARQTLLPKQPIALTGVREAFAVKQGQPAVVVFQSGALIISSTAVPLQAGGAGEVISLRNTDSGTTIRGVVQADGTVRVGMP